MISILVGLSEQLVPGSAVCSPDHVMVYASPTVDCIAVGGRTDVGGAREVLWNGNS